LCRHGRLRFRVSARWLRSETHLAQIPVRPRIRSMAMGQVRLEVENARGLPMFHSPSEIGNKRHSSCSGKLNVNHGESQNSQ
jgi:hypothetical protein